MKNLYLAPLALLLWLLPVGATEGAAQVPPAQYKSIFEALESPVMGQGRVRVFQSAKIAAEVGSPSGALAGATLEGNLMVLDGYRIQMYSGNNSRSRTIATERAQKVRDALPDLDASVEYEAPFWRLRVGGFLDSAEASEYLQILQKEFPAFAKEMYVVRTTIKIPR